MSGPTPRLRRRLGTLMVGIALSATGVLGGCITGDEAEEAIGHDKSQELEEARRLHELGVISDTEYELRKARIEREVEASGR